MSEWKVRVRTNHTQAGDEMVEVKVKASNRDNAVLMAVKRLSHDGMLEVTAILDVTKVKR